MSLRETLNKRPIITSVVGIIAVAVALYVVYSTLTDKGLTAELPTQHYFTVDEGKTLFAAPVTTVAPFEGGENRGASPRLHLRQGQDAVRGLLVEIHR